MKTQILNFQATIKLIEKKIEIKDLLKTGDLSHF